MVLIWFISLFAGRGGDMICPRQKPRLNIASHSFAINQHCHSTMSSSMQKVIEAGRSSITPTTIVLSVLCLAAYITIQDLLLWRKMPPGPQPIPFIGNKLLLDRRWPWIQLESLSKKYGGIFTIWIGRRPTVVISDPQIAIDLMEKRSNIYSAYFLFSSSC